MAINALAPALVFAFLSAGRRSRRCFSSIGVPSISIIEASTTRQFLLGAKLNFWGYARSDGKFGREPHRWYALDFVKGSSLRAAVGKARLDSIRENAYDLRS